MAKVMLAHPLFLSKSPSEQQLSSPYFPLGLLYLASFVRDAGHEVTIFDGTFAADESAFVEQLHHDKPDIVGISALKPTREMALLLAQLAADADTVVAFGGPDPTADPASYLHDECVDLVVHHEGEQTMVRLLELIDSDELDLDVLRDEPGVAFRASGKIVVNPPREPLDDLDALPTPARDLIDMDRYLDEWQESSGYSSITIATTRGCPYGCEWCKGAVHGTNFRQRSPESVAAEVKELAETYGVDRLRMVDDVEGIDRSWFEAWRDESVANGSVVPFEPLNAIEIADLPLLDVQDSL